MNATGGHPACELDGWDFDPADPDGPDDFELDELDELDDSGPWPEPEPFDPDRPDAAESREWADRPR